MTTLTQYINPNQDLCLPVPTEKRGSETISVIWPTHPNLSAAKNRDCICPIAYKLRFQKCNCLNETTYNVNFINRTTDPNFPNYTICWRNIDPVMGMNNTRIYFVAGSHSCEPTSKYFTIPKWRYMQAIKIVINGKRIKLWIAKDKLCTYSPKSHVVDCIN